MRANEVAGDNNCWIAFVPHAVIPHYAAALAFWESSYNLMTSSRVGCPSMAPFLVHVNAPGERQMVSVREKCGYKNTVGTKKTCLLLEQGAHEAVKLRMLS